MRDAKKARAALLVEVSKGHHAGAGATVDDLFQDWIVELRRKGRVNTKTLTDLYAGGDAGGQVDEAERSRRPEKARALFVAATTGLRRAELCALRRRRDIDWEQGIAWVAWSIMAIPASPWKRSRRRTARSVTWRLIHLRWRCWPARSR